MEKGGSEGQKSVMDKPDKTPQEIEESIQSTPTEIWDPFAVLPKEIYVNIFNKLDKAEDKQNFMNAHVKFYDLFKGERVKFLFGKVAEDLQLDDKKSDKNLIGLRLVCREWDRGIQDYYQLHPDRFELDVWEHKWWEDSNHLKKQYAHGYHIELRYGRLEQGGLPFVSVKRDLETDMEQFVASHPPSKNPFITRKIKIEINLSEDEEEDEGLRTLLGQVDALLETYGHHVWHFDFKICYELEQELYSRVLKWLWLMPELRSLQMDFRCGWNTSDSDRLDRILRNDLPKLRKLQNLKVCGFPYHPFNQFMEGIKTLEKVEVTSPGTLRGFQFPASLTEAYLLLDGYEDIEALSKLKPIPVLRSLIIDLAQVYVYDAYKLSWQAIWTTIEEKFLALEDLHLYLPLSYEKDDDDDDNFGVKMMMEQSLECRLNIKKLKKLSLSSEYCPSLDFIQEMKGLQELKIKVDYREGEFEGWDDLVRRETVQFNNRKLDTMWESNIWEVFPNLRKLAIREGLAVPKFGRPIPYHLYKKGAGGQKTYKLIE